MTPPRRSTDHPSQGEAMGTMTFHLPAGLPPEILRELERSCLAGGPDNMPYPTEAFLQGQELLLDRATDESGYLVAPWLVPGVGLLMGTSATLMERPGEYHLLIELARGKCNQVRNQAADWEAGGLELPEPLRRQIHDAAVTLGRGLCSGDEGERLARAQQALEMAHRASGELVELYTRQVFHIRHQRQEKLDTALSCRLGPAVDTPELADLLRGTFNRVSLPISWHQVEGEEARYRWGEADRLLAWAEAAQLEVTAGPLIDFSSAQLPAWLWLWDRDLPSMATFMIRFVEAAVRRYRSRIRRWQLTAASNWANVLGLSEEELLGLTYRLGETARQIDPSLELILGIAQPWGEYMIHSERTSPFIFADNLIRSGLNLAAINLEVVMGVNGRGSYCRDPMDFSRLLDLYALLGVPLQVTLGYSTTGQSDPDADPELAAGAGTRGEGYTPAAQGEWAERFAALALCKPYVQAVQWAHFSDREPHVFPACGLIDRGGQANPALAALRRLREEHLR
jgi:hypothetical protein